MVTALLGEWLYAYFWRRPTPFRPLPLFKLLFRISYIYDADAGPDLQTILIVPPNPDHSTLLVMPNAITEYLFTTARYLEELGLWFVRTTFKRVEPTLAVISICASSILDELWLSKNRRPVLPSVCWPLNKSKNKRLCQYVPLLALGETAIHFDIMIDIITIYKYSIKSTIYGRYFWGNANAPTRETETVWRPANIPDQKHSVRRLEKQYN